MALADKLKALDNPKTHEETLQQMLKAGSSGVGAPKQHGEGFARRVAKVSEQIRFEKPGERLDHEGELRNP